MRKGAAAGACVLHLEHTDAVLNGDGKHIIGPHHMGGFYDLGTVEAHMAFLNQGGGEGAVFYNAGEPQPFIKALGQF